MASTQQASRKSTLKDVAMIGLDVSKMTVHFFGLDATGQVLTRRQCPKGDLLEVTATTGPCRIDMESCSGTHHLGRKLLRQGHDVELFAKRDKNDTKDAEACPRATRRFVSGNSEPQLSVRSLHRYHSRLVGNSTQLISSVRGLRQLCAVPGIGAKMATALEAASVTQSSLPARHDGGKRRYCKKREFDFVCPFWIDGQSVASGGSETCRRQWYSEVTGGIATLDKLTEPQVQRR